MRTLTSCTGCEHVHWSTVIYVLPRVVGDFIIDPEQIVRVSPNKTTLPRRVDIAKLLCGADDIVVVVDNTMVYVVTVMPDSARPPKGEPTVLHVSSADANAIDWKDASGYSLHNFDD